MDRNEFYESMRKKNHKKDDCISAATSSDSRTGICQILFCKELVGFGSPAELFGIVGFVEYDAVRDRLLGS